MAGSPKSTPLATIPRIPRTDVSVTPASLDRRTLTNSGKLRTTRTASAVTEVALHGNTYLDGKPSVAARVPTRARTSAVGTEVRTVIDQPARTPDSLVRVDAPDNGPVVFFERAVEPGLDRSIKFYVGNGRALDVPEGTEDLYDEFQARLARLSTDAQKHLGQRLLSELSDDQKVAWFILEMSFGHIRTVDSKNRAYGLFRNILFNQRFDEPLFQPELIALMQELLQALVIYLHFRRPTHLTRVIEIEDCSTDYLLRQLFDPNFQLQKQGPHKTNPSLVRWDLTHHQHYSYLRALVKEVRRQVAAMVEQEDFNPLPENIELESFVERDGASYHLHPDGLYYRVGKDQEKVAVLYEIKSTVGEPNEKLASSSDWRVPKRRSGRNSDFGRGFQQFFRTVRCLLDDENQNLETHYDLVTDRENYLPEAERVQHARQMFRRALELRGFSAEQISSVMDRLTITYSPYIQILTSDYAWVR